MSSTKKIKQLYDRYLIPVYTRNGIAAVRGKGSWLWNAEGKKWLDLFPGWGVDGLGHSHPKIQQAVAAQLKQLIHVPNNFYHAPQAELAKALIDRSFPGKVFFTNSGAESVEAAIKLVRSVGAPKRAGATRRYEIIALKGAFHGRTLGAIAATGQPKYARQFRPLPGGFRHVPLNDFKALKKAIRKETIAILLEPIQGEGGIHPADKTYLKAVRQLCSQKKLVLIFDEVSTGMGRTGSLFAYQQLGVRPDILLLAKPMAGGLPLGALIAHRSIADTWAKGSHASTFGGNPIVTAAGLATLKVIDQERLLDNVQRRSKQLLKGLKQLQAQSNSIKEIRGLGLMIGIELNRPGAKLVEAAAQAGVLINCTQGNVIRLYPALNITSAEVNEGLKRLGVAWKRFESK